MAGSHFMPIWNGPRQSAGPTASVTHPCAHIIILVSSSGNDDAPQEDARIQQRGRFFR